jgi:septum formation protein
MGDLPGSGVSRKLVLASSSPRRRELLHTSGFVFEIRVPNVPEDALPGEEPSALVERLARAKADVIAQQVAQDCCVIAADTVVVLDQRIYGKPSGTDEAAEMLGRLAGRQHEVLTGYCLQLGRADAPSAAEAVSGVSRSLVQMREVERAEAERYAASGEPLDKAGGYAVQGDGGRFVSGIQGLRSNVIGLPVEDITPLLARFGVLPQ